MQWLKVLIHYRTPHLKTRWIRLDCILDHRLNQRDWLWHSSWRAARTLQVVILSYDDIREMRRLPARVRHQENGLRSKASTPEESLLDAILDDCVDAILDDFILDDHCIKVSKTLLPTERACIRDIYHAFEGTKVQRRIQD